MNLRIYAAMLHAEGGTTDNDGAQIDEYWNNVLENEVNDSDLKFKYLPLIANPLLCLVHGIANPECGFSVNKRTVSSNDHCCQIRQIIHLEQFNCHETEVHHDQTTTYHTERAAAVASQERLEADKCNNR